MAWTLVKVEDQIIGTVSLSFFASLAVFSEIASVQKVLTICSIYQSPAFSA